MTQLPQDSLQFGKEENIIRIIAAYAAKRAGEIGAAMALLPALRENRLREAAPRAALWPYGLSGDLPILCCRALSRIIWLYAGSWAGSISPSA